MDLSRVMVTQEFDYMWVYLISSLQIEEERGERRRRGLLTSPINKTKKEITRVVETEENRLTKGKIQVNHTRRPPTKS